MKTVVQNIIRKLEEPLKKEFPFRYELGIREKLLSDLRAAADGDDASIIAALKGIERDLSNKAYEDVYAYQRLICNEYLKAVRKYIPKEAESSDAGGIESEDETKYHWAFVNNKWNSFIGSNS